MLTKLYLRLKCFLFQHQLKDEKKRKVNMVAQLIFGILVIGIGLFFLIKFVYDMGKYPSDLTDGHASYWYDSESDSLLSVDAAMFTFISNNNNVYIEGEVREQEFVSDVGLIKYSISDGKCNFEYQEVDYSLTYYSPEKAKDIVKEFESRLIKENKTN